MPTCTCGSDQINREYLHQHQVTCFWFIREDRDRLLLQNDALTKRVAKYSEILDKQNEEFAVAKRLVGRMQNALEDIITETVTAHDGGAILPIREMAQRGLGLTEKPKREGLCTNSRDGEDCLKRAGHEGICEGPQHVWDWKPTLGRKSVIEKRNGEGGGDRQ